MTQLMGYTLRIILLQSRLAEIPMRGRRSALVVLLTDDEQATLQHWCRSTSTPVGLVRRAQMILAVADGQRFTQAAHQAGLTEKHGRKWVNRFLQERLDGLYDKPGRGRKPVFSPGSGFTRYQDRL
jgi:Helix-turn-helix domain